MNNMTPDSKQKWNKYFEALDVDKDGLIKVSVLIDKLNDFECDPLKRKKLKKLLMKRKDITINYTDFLAKVIDIKEVFTEEDIINTFKYFDQKNSGAINADDISSYMHRKGEDCQKDQAMEMLKVVDKKNLRTNNKHYSENVRATFAKRSK